MAQNNATNTQYPATSTSTALVRWSGTTGLVFQDGVITEDNTGNLSVSAAVSGGSLSVTVANTSNTASATAFHNAQVAGGTAADAYYKAEISGGQAWTMGLDNSDSDAFVISSSATPGTTNVMRVATTGEINYPLQTAFLSVLETTDSNVAGNSGTYTLGSGNALTEIFDQNSDISTTGTFTAPVTGRYFFTFTARVAGVVSSVNSETFIVTSNRSYAICSQSGSAVKSTGQGWKPTGSSLTDMDAADTATFTISGSGEASNVWDIIGTADPTTFVSGYLVC